MSVEFWSDEELAVLKECYRKFGSDWEGWEEALPNRTMPAIITRARKLGLRKTIVHKVHKSHEGPRTEEAERYCIRKMHDGMTPTQIDEARHWIPGTARLIIRGRWERQSE